MIISTAEAIFVFLIVVESASMLFYLHAKVIFRNETKSTSLFLLLLKQGFVKSATVATDCEFLFTGAVLKYKNECESRVEKGENQKSTRETIPKNFYVDIIKDGLRFELLYFDIP